MAPEVVRHRPYGVGVDIYSWGMCVYSLNHLDPCPPTQPSEQIMVGMLMQHF